MEKETDVSFATVNRWKKEKANQSTKAFNEPGEKHKIDFVSLVDKEL